MADETKVITVEKDGKEEEITLVLDDIIEKANKNESLTAEEEQFLLESEGAPAEYEVQHQLAEEKEEEKEETAEEKAAREKKEKEEKEESPEEKAAREKKEKEEKESKESPEEKAAREKKEKEEQKPEDALVKIERELQKPEGQADLTDFTEREKAYFHQMKRDRAAKQKAESDLDAAKFRDIKAKKDKEAKEKKEAEEKKEDPLAELKKRDQGDFMTVEDVVKILEKVQTKPAAKEKEEAAPKQDPMKVRFYVMCDAEARKEHSDDYDAVMELTDEIITPSEKYGAQVAQAMLDGKNPALVMYELIKADPEFAKLFPAAKTRVEARARLKAEKPEKKKEEKKEKTPEEIEKEKKAKEAQDLLEKNKDKTKTTGHAAGSEEAAAGNLTLEQITNMSDAEFAALPKKTRDHYLKLYG